jgi:hypothetical protein
MSSTQQLLLGEGAGGGAVAANYIEEVFSTYLYNGSASSQTLVTGIDLSTKGGMVWGKSRSSGVYNHEIVDTVRGVTSAIFPNRTLAADIQSPSDVTSFNINGVTLRGDSIINLSGGTQVLWTFRKQPKFFDIVTWTGTGTSTRVLSHALGSVPGCIIIKVTSTTNNWFVYHRGLTSPDYCLLLNTTDGEQAGTGYTGATPTAPTATEFTMGGSSTNASGETYVAYLFAHDAGGFGLTGTDNVITCGVYTNDSGSVPYQVNLGYEPQWVMIKTLSADRPRGWYISDNMRGVPTDGADAELLANTTAAETTADGDVIDFNATGFAIKTSAPAFQTWGPHIYIAIRRGPMKVPTVGTTVFAPVTYTGNNTTRTITTNFPVSQYFIFRRDATSTGNISVFDRLRGYSQRLITSGTAAETSDSSFPLLDSNTGVVLQGSVFNTSGESRGIWAFQRAPSFFDEVCYTGNGTAGRAISHNLTVVPELMIVKKRSSATNSDWPVYSANLGNLYFLKLNLDNAVSDSVSYWNNTTPTSSVFTVGSGTFVNLSAETYVAYLFATCAGVSKVGSYTGTGALLTVNCGFTSGARFVLIKRTDSTGDWYVYDSARGITASNDPYLLMNSTVAEVTGTNYVDTDTTGFKVTAAAPAGLNASGGTYIFLAIA